MKKRCWYCYLQKKDSSWHETCTFQTMKKLYYKGLLFNLLDVFLLWLEMKLNWGLHKKCEKKLKKRGVLDK